MVTVMMVVVVVVLHNVMVMMVVMLHNRRGFSGRGCSGHRSSGDASGKRNRQQNLLQHGFTLSFWKRAPPARHERAFAKILMNRT